MDSNKDIIKVSPVYGPGGGGRTAAPPNFGQLKKFGQS